MTPQEFEIKIGQAIDNALFNGWEIISDSWGSLKDKKCCAIGAYVLLENPEIKEDAFSKACSQTYHVCNQKQEFTSTNFWNFIVGFNLSNIQEFEFIQNDWFALGMKLNEKYKPSRKIKPIEDTK